MGKKSFKHKRKTNNDIKFNICNFTPKNFYLFIVPRYNSFLFGIKNLNSIKPNYEEIDNIEKEINECVNKYQNKNNIKSINIMPNFYKIFKDMKKIDTKNSEYGKNIKFIIDILKKNNEIITLKKIAEKYNQLFNIKISITTVSRVLKRHLNIRYLKTAIKNPKLEEYNYMIMSFIFIRCIIRSISLKLNFVFIDETGFLLENNNFYSWRSREEEIYLGAKIKSKERLNLILGVSKTKVIAKKFIKGSVDSEMFISFLKDILKVLSEEEKDNTMIIMDNATYHVSKEVINFFKNNRMKGLTICPYRSPFNMIELVFRYVKNIIYKNVYSNMLDLKNDVIKILESNHLKDTLINLYKETLQKYIIFINNNIDYNLDK